MCCWWWLQIKDVCEREVDYKIYHTLRCYDLICVENNRPFIEKIIDAYKYL